MEAIRVRGVVQGVGFRPAVYRLARARGLHGDVCNDGDGVLIRVAGAASHIDDFVAALRAEAPPLARIEQLDRRRIPDLPAGDFRIIHSASGEARTHVSPDAATCAACLAETFDPASRRYGYAFTNCTHCGPRLSIVRAIPYDRLNTSMAGFELCSDCAAEYHDPGDRRFHAQPIACPACGPHLWLEDTRGEVSVADNAAGMSALAATAARLRRGYIVAIKGLGGFHLACDATDADAVARLRARKHRFGKPFALMAADAAMLRRHCLVTDAELALLQATPAPIVLLQRQSPDGIAPAVAPRQGTLGFMLPYTPLHHLLMAQLDRPIVMTSGNRSEEPQCIHNEEARQRLVDIADAFLLHDRPIINRVDDAVARVVAGRTRLLRRARGYAPMPLPLPPGFQSAPPVLAFGGELKNTVCLLRADAAIVSQHLGDLENRVAFEAYRETLELYLALFEHAPAVCAVDRHPEYLASKHGREWARTRGLPLTQVQHHHAHIAACLAENGVAREAPVVLGVALDGLGYGVDGSLWGGEFLAADYRSHERLGAFEAVPMPGGVQAIRQPWRMAYAYLQRHFDVAALLARHPNLPFGRRLASQPLDTLSRMIERDLNCPLTSSCGRLFDAVAAAADLCPEASYEGQAAIELEAVVDRDALETGQAYPLTLVAPASAKGIASISTRPLWQALLRDLGRNLEIGVVAARFHNGLIEAIAAMIEHLTNVHHDPWQHRVALSGGVFQNAIVSERLVARLERSGFAVYTPAQLPANDGGLSLGQAMIAAAQLLSDCGRSKPCA